MNTRDPQAPKFKCPQCASGMLHPRRVTVWQRVGGHRLTVPNFPAWRCDVCNRLEYDAQAWAGLMIMLAGPRRPVRAAQRPVHHRSA